MPPQGLANLGDTCFANACLQAIFASEPLREAFMARTTSPLLSAISACFRAMESVSDRPGARGCAQQRPSAQR
jgi:ubiquitin C-terminal hydrolase